MNGQFLNELHVKPLSDGQNWILLGSLKYQDSTGDIHVVPTGFKTDFASIPPLSTIAGIVSAITLVLCGIGIRYHIAWLLLVCMALTAFAHVVVIISYSLNCDDQLDAPATLHDNGYQRPRLGRTPWRMKFYWDALLLDAMKATKRPLWKRQLIYWNVTLFGWGAWYSDARKMKNQHTHRD